MSKSTKQKDQEQQPVEQAEQTMIMVDAVIPTFEQIIEKQIKKYDLPAAKIAELEAEFMPLTIAGIEDKDGYEKVRLALKTMVSKRNEVDDKRKELKADSLKFGRAVDEEAKRLTLLMQPIEEHLKTQKDAIDAELKAIQEAAEKAKELAIKNRHLKLIEIGLTIAYGEDTYWYINPITQQEYTFHKLNLETMEDDSFEVWVANFVAMKKDTDWNLEQIAIAEKKEEEERIAEAKRKEEEVAEQKRKQDEQQKIIDDAAKAQAEEIAAFKNERMESRKEVLYSLGLYVNYSDEFAYKTVKLGECLIVHYNKVYEANTADWQAKLIEIKSKVQELNEADQMALKEENEAKEKQRLLTEERNIKLQPYIIFIRDYNRLVNLQEDEFQKEFDDIVKGAEQHWEFERNEVIRKQKEEEEAKEKKEKEAAAAESERIANLSDKDKMSEWVKKLLILTPPVMATKKWTGLKNQLVELIESYK